jgi:hypothetical protein
VNGFAQGNFGPCPSPQTGDICSTSTSYVGIGTNTPGFRLTLGLGNGPELRVFGIENRAIFAAKNSAGNYESYLWPRWSDDIMYLNYGAAGFNIRNNSAVSTMFMDDSGRVGIGTITPGFKLTLGLGDGPELRVFGIENRAIFAAKNSAGNYESYLWPRWSDDIMYLNYGAAGFNIRNNSAVSTMFMDNSGRVGIGAAAADRLTVFGGTSNINIGGNYGAGYNGIWLNGGTGGVNYNLLSSAADATLYINSTAALQFRIANATKMFLDGNGDLGIGTLDPKGRLDVRTATVLPGSGWGTAQLMSTDALAADKGGVLNFGGAYTSQGTVSSWASIAGLKTNATDQDVSGYLAFYTRSGGSVPAERMRIDSGGVVSIGGTGLGTDSSDKLIVNGGIRAVAVIGAVYQDVAEWVPASEPMVPGTVVVVDSGVRNSVAASKQAYDTAVAGVISAQPGVLLGVEGPSKVKVATTGRVKVRVDASLHPIRAGDLLVTSDKPGVAMRSEPVDIGGLKMHRPGTLIGKALEPLGSGEGEILVLLSLQ